MKNDESILQQHCVALFRTQWPRLAKRLWAIPNGGFRNIATAVRLKKEGVTPGVSDLMLSIPKNGYGGLFIEMKTKTGVQSKSQKDFVREHELDYKCVIVRSVDQFMKEVRTYLNK